MSKKLKIAIFTPYNIFKHGGVQEHVQEHAKILRRRGHSVTVLTPRPRLSKNEDAPEGTVFLGSSARIKAPHATSADVSITVDNDAIDAQLDRQFDILHVHEPLVPIAARQILSRAEEYNVVRVGTFHAALPGNALGKSLVTTYKTYARSVLPLVDVITAVTPAAIGYIGKYASTEIAYIPNGINTKLYKARKVKRDPNLVLFIGRLEKRKGVMQLLEAFTYLKTIKPEARLIIGGNGPLRQNLENYVREHDIDDVEFLGYVEDEKKIELLSTCSIYTSPALYGESFGIVLAEAMAMQAPIVCHANEGYSWVMQGTGRLSLVNCKDAEAYAHRMQLMMEDNALRKAWVEWSKSYVKQFDYERIVDKYEKLYEMSLSKRKK